MVSGPFCVCLRAVQVSALQDGIKALGRAHMRSAPSLRKVPPALPLKQFRRWSDGDDHPFSSFPRKIVERLLCLRRSPPVDQCCDVLGFGPVCVVSSSSTLQIFRDSSPLWWLLCPPVGHFPNSGMSGTVHLQESASKVNVEHCHIFDWVSLTTFNFL